MSPAKSVLILTFLTSSVNIALAAPPNRVLARVDDSRRVFLNGHMHPKAQRQLDQGRVSASLELTHLALSFKPSAAQQAQLDQLLADQQDPASPQYHRW